MDASLFNMDMSIGDSLSANPFIILLSSKGINNSLKPECINISPMELFMPYISFNLHFYKIAKILLRSTCMYSIKNAILFRHTFSH